MTDIRAALMEKSKKVGVKVDAGQADLFQRYMELLLEWNEKMNLTAITDPAEIVEKHFVDSLSLLSLYQPKQGAKLIDVGTGAGFPGSPLKIMRPDLKLTLLDSLNKRLNFLKAVCTELGLESTLVHRRAEEAGLDKTMRESFDVAVARAVAPLNVLCEYCIPLIKMKGIFFAMKGPAVQEELNGSSYAIELLGGEETVLPFLLPDGEERTLIKIQKKRFTPKGYPRHGGTIAKHPLSSGNK